jgi:hypothetical protein
MIRGMLSPLSTFCFRLSNLCVCGLTLAHLVARLRADHPQTALAADDLAIFTAALD